MQNTATDLRNGVIVAIITAVMTLGGNWIFFKKIQEDDSIEKKKFEIVIQTVKLLSKTQFLTQPSAIISTEQIRLEDEFNAKNNRPVSSFLEEQKIQTKLSDLYPVEYQKTIEMGDSYADLQAHFILLQVMFKDTKVYCDSLSLLAQHYKYYRNERTKFKEKELSPTDFNKMVLENQTKMQSLSNELVNKLFDQIEQK